MTPSAAVMPPLDEEPPELDEELLELELEDELPCPEDVPAPELDDELALPEPDELLDDEDVAAPPELEDEELAGLPDDDPPPSPPPLPPPPHAPRRPAHNSMPKVILFKLILFINPSPSNSIGACLYKTPKSVAYSWFLRSFKR